MKLKHSIIALAALCSMAFTSCGDGNNEPEFIGKANITLSTTSNAEYKKCVIETVDYTVTDATGKIVRSEVKHSMDYNVELTNIKAPLVLIYKRSFQLNSECDLTQSHPISRTQKDVVELVDKSYWKDESAKATTILGEDLTSYVDELNSNSKTHSVIVTKEGSIVHAEK